MEKQYEISCNETKMLFFEQKNIIFDIGELSKKEINHLKLLFSSIKGNDEFKLFENEKVIKEKYYGTSMCIIPSNICQLKCKYCYSESGKVNKCDYSDFKRIKECIDSIFYNNRLYKHQKNPYVYFLFHGGGEPTENWEFFKKIVMYIFEKKTSTDSRIYLRLVTNGIFNETQAVWIGKHFNEVIVSIDGLPEINDNVRVFRNGLGSTSISMRSAQILSQYTGVGIHAVVTALSKDKASEIVSFFKSNIQGLRFINFQRCRTTMSGRNDAFLISNEDYINFILEAKRKAPDLVRSAIIDFNRKGSFCKACAGSMIYCFPNGSVTLCNEHDNGIYSIGTYGEGIKIDNYAYEKYKNSINEKIKKLNCKNCFAYTFCRGGCHSYYEQCDDFSKEWCEVYRKALSMLFFEKLHHDNVREIVLNGQRIKYLNLNNEREKR